MLRDFTVLYGYGSETRITTALMLIIIKHHLKKSLNNLNFELLVFKFDQIFEFYKEATF